MRFSNFTRDASLADYLYTNWNNLKFPQLFTMYVKNAELWFPVKISLQDKQIEKLYEIEKAFPNEDWSFRKKTHPKLHTMQLVERVQNHPWAVRVSAHYYDSHQKRFFHSAYILRMPKLPTTGYFLKDKTVSHLHPATASFCRSPMQKVAMFNKDHTMHGPIQKVESKFGGAPLHKDTFKSSIKPPNHAEKEFTKHVEKASCSYFHFSEQRFGTQVAEFSVNKRLSYTNPYQPQPDVILDNSRSNLKDQRIHNYDFKSGNINWTNNIVVSNRSFPNYAALMGNHKTFMEEKQTLTRETEKVCDNLTLKYADVTAQQGVLFPNLHIFKNGLDMPPLYSPDNFYTGNLSIKATSSYKAAQNKVMTVDDYITDMKISKPKTDAEWHYFYETIFPQIISDLDKKFGNQFWATNDEFFDS